MQLGTILYVTVFSVNVMVFLEFALITDKLCFVFFGCSFLTHYILISNAKYHSIMLESSTSAIVVLQSYFDDYIIFVFSYSLQLLISKRRKKRFHLSHK